MNPSGKLPEPENPPIMNLGCLLDTIFANFKHIKSIIIFAGHQFIIASLFSKLYAHMSLKAISEPCFFVYCKEYNKLEAE